ncbi:MAG: glutamine-hydrolyzing carbamoyl-phosphate synthase small subunit [Nitrospirota bacterium]|nr:MAG: glutamine-hydrolyzing carbamoyl-phosphate synthase small subunit [Nitrospirota bacterium]
MEAAVLALADGTVFKGEALGFRGEAVGEVVFNTAMTGYQEILTDPSYKGQIVLMTSTQIGNYGATSDDDESRRVWPEGFIVREASKRMSNWRGQQSFEEYLLHHEIVSIQGIDTRALTSHLREKGSQVGVISHVNFEEASLCAKAQASPSIVGRDLVREVTCSSSYQWSKGTMGINSKTNDISFSSQGAPPSSYKIVVMDFGVKYQILRSFVDVGCHVQVVPATTSADDIRQLQPDGLFLSNGPGDPEGVPYAVKTVKALLGWKPIFGICLGHQILGLALGLDTHKLPFGHHGANHPVMDLRTRKIEITSQNHNFAVTLPHKEQEEALWETQHFDTPIGRMEVTHRSLNDGCCEGMIGLDSPILSVQYHPEASPGPHDSSYLFQQFIDMMKR